MLVTKLYQPFTAWCGVGTREEVEVEGGEAIRLKEIGYEATTSRALTARHLVRFCVGGGFAAGRTGCTCAVRGTRTRAGARRRRCSCRLTYYACKKRKRESRRMSMAKGRELGGHMREECGTGLQCRHARDGRARVKCGWE